MSDRSHLLPFPIWTIVLRGVQLTFAIVVMGLAAYGIYYYPLSGGFAGVDMNMFTAIETIITVVYILVSFFFLPIAYNYWAILGLDILAVIFWLISFALLASEVQTYKSDFDEFGACVYEFDGVCYGYKRSFIEKRSTTIEDYYHAMTATAVFGAFEFVLFVITLVFTSMWLHRHRTAGGHCIPGSSGPNNSSIERKPGANQPVQIPMENVSKV